MKKSQKFNKKNNLSSNKKQRREYEQELRTNEEEVNEESEEEEEEEEDEDEMTSTLIQQNQINSKSKSLSLRKDTKRLIVVLENACLETIKVGSSHELLNVDKHKQQIIKFKKDPANCRPDILHQCLLMLFDSPLNRANLLQVFIILNVLDIIQFK
jgi:hypothetical protein